MKKQDKYPMSAKGAMAYLAAGLLTIGALTVAAFTTENGTIESIIFVGMMLSAIGLYFFGSYLNKQSAIELQQLLADKKQEQLEQSNARGEAAVEKINSTMSDLFELHCNALSVQYRKMVHTDSYGNTILDRWKEEQKYFRRTIVEPSLNPEDTGEAIVHLWLGLDQDLQSGVIDLHGEDGTALRYFKMYLESYINCLVEDYMDTRTGEDNINVDSISPSEFEQLCADRLESAGWNTQVAAGSGDQGVDIVARSGNTTAVFQCKRYLKPLGNTPVQEVFTGKQFYKAQIAAVVTNADYTPGARAAAEQTGVLLLHYSELDSFTPPESTT